MANTREMTWPQILRDVWADPARSLRVLGVVNTGSGYAELAGDANGNLNVNLVNGSISVTMSGADGAILDGVSATIRATVLDLVSSNPLAVAITDAAGAQITSFGGGTQYDEGAVDTTITGTAAMWEDASDTLRAISMAKALPVQPGTGAQFPVLGTIPNGTTGSPFPVVIGGVAPSDGHIHTFSVHHTAGGLFPMLSLLIDAADHALDIKSTGEVYGLVGSTDDTKTNAHYLKTSSDGTLVFPNVTVGGAELTAIKTAVEIMDDWDESDRAKTNPIVGQAGVAGGDGATGATTQRVTTGVTEATFGTADLQGTNLTSTSAWTLALATPGNPWRLIEVINNTDVAIQVSYDANNRRMTYPPNTGMTRDYFPLGIKISTAVHVRNDGSTPSRGRVYVHGETV